MATNALLERKGERCCLVTSKGFRDLLHIGNQSRPAIFDLEISIPDVLYDHVVEVDEQVSALTKIIMCFFVDYFDTSTELPKSFRMSFDTILSFPDHGVVISDLIAYTERLPMSNIESILPGKMCHAPSSCSQRLTIALCRRSFCLWGMIQTGDLARTLTATASSALLVVSV